TVEAPQCRQGTGRGALGEAPLLQRAQPRPDRQPVHAGPAPAAAVVAAAKGGEVREIAGVGCHGVGRVVAFLGKELDERGDLGDRRRPGHGCARLKPRLGAAAEAARPFTGRRRVASSLARLTLRPPLRCSARTRPYPPAPARPAAVSSVACPSPAAPAARAGRSWRSSAESVPGLPSGRSGTARRASSWGAGAGTPLPRAAARGLSPRVSRSPRTRRTPPLP